MSFAFNLQVLREFCYAQSVSRRDLGKHAHEHIHLMSLGKVRYVQSVDGLSKILDVNKDW